MASGCSLRNSGVKSPFEQLDQNKAATLKEWIMVGNDHDDCAILYLQSLSVEALAALINETIEAGLLDD
jgi:hypothetical protein